MKKDRGFSFFEKKKGRVYYALGLSPQEEKRLKRKNNFSFEGSYTQIEICCDIAIVSFPTVKGGASYNEIKMRNKILSLVRIMTKDERKKENKKQKSSFGNSIDFSEELLGRRWKKKRRSTVHIWN